MIRPLPASTTSLLPVSTAGNELTARAGGGSLTDAQTQQELAFVQTAPVAIPLLLIIAAGLAKSLNRPEQARQAKELQEQFLRTLSGLRWLGSFTPQQFDQILSEFKKALKREPVGFSSFLHWLKQFSSGTDTKIEAKQKKFDAALTQARTSNSSLVDAMQKFSNNSPLNFAGLRALQNQAKAALITLQSARDTMKDLLAQAEAASLPAASRETLKQVNGWIATATKFSQRLEQHIARLPELGRERRQTTPPAVSRGNIGARVTHTNVEGGGSVTGEHAAKLEKKSREQYSQKLEQAAAWVRKQRQNGSRLSDAELSKQAARNIFGSETHAGAIANAVTAGGGVHGAKNGGVRAGVQGTGEGNVAISGIDRGNLPYHLPYHDFPEDRQPSFDITALPAKAFESAMKIVEERPISNPRYFYPAYGVFERLFQALNTMGMGSSLSHRELGYLIQWLNGYTNRKSSFDLVLPDLEELTQQRPKEKFLPRQQTAVVGFFNFIHEWHLLVGFGQSPSIFLLNTDAIPGHGGESGFLAKNTNTVPSRANLLKILELRLKDWKDALEATNRKSFMSDIPSLIENQEQALKTLMMYYQNGWLAEASSRINLQAWVRELSRWPEDINERLRLAKKIVTDIEERGKRDFEHGLPLSGIATEAQLLQTIYYFFDRKNPSLQMDFQFNMRELWDYYKAEYDAGKLITLTDIREILQRLKIKYVE
jgi:hypothetical protein